MRPYVLIMNAKAVADYFRRGYAEKAFHRYCQKYPNDVIYVSSIDEGIILTNQED